jgi:hypothetical protein
VSDLPNPWPEARYYAGVDWGFVNQACVLVGMKTHADDTLWILEEAAGTRWTNEDLTRRVCALADRYPIELFYRDPAEPGSIDSQKQLARLSRDEPHPARYSGRSGKAQHTKAEGFAGL